MRRAAAAVVSAVASAALPVNEWPELLPHLAQCAAAAAPEAARESAHAIMGELMEELGDEYFKDHLQALHTLFVQGMRDPAPRVRAAALQATARLVASSTHMDGQARDASLAAPLVEPVVAVARAAATEDDKTAVAALDLLEDFVTAPGAVLGKGNAMLPTLLNLAVEVASTAAAELAVRKRAVEVIEGAVRRKPRALSKGRAPLAPGLVASLCPLCAVDGTGADGDNRLGGAEEDVDDVPLRRHAMSTLESFSEYVPAKHILPAAMSYARVARTSQAFAERAAAMDVLGVSSIGCAEEMRLHLDDFLQPVLAGLADTHFRVRGSAAVALANYAEHLQPEIIETYATLLPRVFELLGDSDMHVVERACFVLATFCEELSDNDRGDEIVPYVSRIIDTMVAILQTDRVDMHEVALSAITAAACAADEGFAPYAAGVLEKMAMCMRLPANTDVEAARRGRATECAGMVLSSIGREHATPYINTFVELALSNYESGNAELKEHTHNFWCNVSTLAREEMGPLLPKIVPHLLKSAEESDFNEMFFSPEAEGNGAGADGALGGLGDSDNEDDDLRLGDGLRVRTALLEEKQAAVQALGVLAEQCGRAFGPYLEGSLSVVEDMMQYFHGDVREAACRAATGMCECARRCAPAQGAPAPPSEEDMRGPDGRALSEREAAITLSPEARKVFNQMMHGLHEVASQDDERDVVGAAVTSLAVVVRLMGGEAFEKWAERVSEVVGALLARNHPCFEWDEEEEAGEEDEDDDMVHESRVMDAASDVLPAMAFVMREKFAPFLAAHARALWEYARPKRPAADRTMVVAALGEIGEYMPGLLAPYTKELAALLLAELKCSNAQNHRNAAFCVRVLASLPPAQFPPVAVAQCLEGLGPLLNADEEGAARDNVVSAICAIAKAHPQQCPPEQALAAVVPFLPLTDDVQECLPVFDYLCGLMESSPGATAAYAQAILGAMGATAGDSNIPKRAVARMHECITRLNTAYPGALQDLVRGLPQEAQQGLEMLAARGK